MILLLAVHARAADPAIPGPAPTAPGLKVVFMGADVAVLHKKDYHRIRGVESGAFVIEVGGRRVKVPSDDRNLRFRVEPSLKLAGVLADIERLSGDRTFTSARDPRRKLDAAAGAAGGASAAVDLALFRQNEAEAAYASISRSGFAPAAAVEAARENQENARRDFGSAMDQLSSDFNRTTNAVERTEAERMDGNYDAVELQFEVASPVPLTEPYLVVLTQYRARGAPPGPAQNRVYARALDPLGARARRISFRQGGFPPGFELEGFQVHLYNGGEEIATSLSPKRVPLAADEAFQFLVLEHITANKGATLPAEPVVGQLPADLRGRLTAEQFDQTFYVRVASDGRVIEAYTDAACTTRVADRHVVRALERVLFKPALEKGRPVEGVARLKLSHLPQ